MIKISIIQNNNIKKYNVISYSKLEWSIVLYPSAGEKIIIKLADEYKIYHNWKIRYNKNIF